MSHTLDLIEERQNSSKFDPVIWEDVAPIEELTNSNDELLSDLINVLCNDGNLSQTTIEELQNLLK